MKIVNTIKEMQALSQSLRCGGKKIGFVPTMGALHEGHLSLIHIAKRYADIVIASIYVNPLQFSPNEDFDRYPRQMEKDLEHCRACGVDIVFSPTDSLYYPDDSTHVEETTLSRELCGISRPQFFPGVCTVVTKLFNIISPHVAVFGQKDAQQAAVIKRLVRDLFFNIEIIVGNTVREEDGLAMSSRNTYLTPQQRIHARAIYQSLEKVRDMIEQGNKNVDRVSAEITHLISQQRNLRLIYVSIVNKDTMEPLREITLGQTLIAVAVWCDEVRLIDNIVI